MDTLLHLLHYGLGWLTIFGKEGLIITESATSPPFDTITIGAGEPGIDRDFLYSCAELVF
jgi:hypothetical protein